MTIHLNREIKAYCPDFAPIRQLLQASGAAVVEAKEQVDYYFRLPGPGGDTGPPRLKLRVEGETRELIFYQDSFEGDKRVSHFRRTPVYDSQLLDVLEAALGIRAIVHKQRELWQMHNVRYNLDTVEGVGQILEVEVQAEDGRDIEAQIEENNRLLAPYLGPRITSSNENLVRDSMRP